MATKTQAAIEELLASYLHEGEEFRWVGEPKRNSWHLKLGSFPMMIAWLIRLLHLVLFSLRWVFALVLGFGGVLLIGYSVLHTLYIYSASKDAIFFFHGEFWIGSFLFFVAKGLFNTYRKANNLGKPSLSELPRFWERSYFAVTNQRIVVFEQGTVHDYSLILMADAIVGKPKNGASTIYMYSSTNPTGQLPKSIFELKGIIEEEAQNAYEILRQAREEALEDRAREMGIE
jgi:hypothetical protein